MSTNSHESSQPRQPAHWRAARARGFSHECFADEIAIDFPSVGPAVDRIRDAFLGVPEDERVLATEVRVSPQDARRGLVVPLVVPMHHTCRVCDGRGETWTGPCEPCGGFGASIVERAVRFALPPRVADGASFRFRVTLPHAPTVRVEVRVAIRTAA